MSNLILLGLVLLSLFGCGRKDIIINNLSDFALSESKICIPVDAVNKTYTWKELCEYYGKDVSFQSLPETFDDDIKNQTFEMYVDSDGNVVYDNVELYYQATSDQYIRLIVAKEKLPVTDEMCIGGVYSTINGKQLEIYKVNDTYYSAFIYDGIGYNLTARGLSQDEYIELLKEKIQ